MSRAPLALWLLLGTLGTSLVALGVANDLDRATDPRLMSRDLQSVTKLHRFHFAPSEAVTIRAASLSQPAARVSFEEVIAPAKASTLPKLVETPPTPREAKPIHGAIVLMPSFVNPTKIAAAAERKQATAAKTATKQPKATTATKKQPSAAKVTKATAAKSVAASQPTLAPPLVKQQAKRPQAAKPQAAVAAKASIVLYPAEPIEIITRYELKRLMRNSLPGDLSTIERHLERYGYSVRPAIASNRIPAGEVVVGPNRVPAKVAVIRNVGTMQLAAATTAALDGRMVLFQGISTLHRLEESAASQEAEARKSEIRPTAMQKKLLEFIDGAEQRLGDLVETIGRLNDLAAWLNRQCDESFYRLSLRVRNELWQSFGPATTKSSPIRSAGRPQGGAI